MVKWITTIITFFMLAGNVSPSVSPCRIVTEISVQWIQEDRTFQKTYTDPEKTDALLLCLRALESSIENPAPEASGAADCTLRILLSDGTTKKYQLRGIQHFRDNDGVWRSVKPEAVLHLYLVLAATPDDL